MMSQSFRVRNRLHTDTRVDVPISSDMSHVRPSSADGEKRRKPKRHSSASNNKAGIRKLAKMFHRSREEDLKLKIPPGFFDEYEAAQRSLSPDSPFQRNRYYSLGSRTAFKLKRMAKEKDEPFFMWKPCKRKCEWESMSGRQLSIQDATYTDLSKAELDALQRVAIARLQGMDIAVSFGLLKSRSGMFGKMTNSMRRKISNERPVSTAVFGQPLAAVIDNERNRNAMGSPTSSSPPISFLNSTSTPSSTFQHHPEQPVAATSDEETTDVLANSSLSEQLATSPKACSPLSPRHDSLYPLEPQVPLVVQKAIHHLDNNGIKTEGIFRVPGAKARIDEIRRQFDKGEDVELPDDANPHDVACLFKEFFRSLPEPLMTRELYQPLLQTRKLQSRSQQKEALNLLCLLLPRPNRDTLRELVEFLSRVALHSNDTILLDGTEEAGNRMSTQNLATVLGPNIIHNEVRRKNNQNAFHVMKTDPEELASVCTVMEDLILMHDDIFKIPAELYDTALRNIFLTDHKTVDVIFKRKCEQPVDHDCSRPSLTSVGSVLRSSSSDCLRNVRTGSMLVSSEIDPQRLAVWHQRSRSLSDNDEQILDSLMKSIEDMLKEDFPSSHRRHSSNDSAMGESECVTSPCQHPHNDSSSHDPSMYNSVDSAISNHSSRRSSSSCEGVSFTINDLPTLSATGSNTTVQSAIPAHVRMSSEASILSESPAPSFSNPQIDSYPKFIPEASPYYRSSLPVLTPSGILNDDKRSSSSLSFIRRLRKSSSTNSGKGFWSKKRRLNKSKGSLDEKMPEYPLQRSPILGRRFGWEDNQRVDSASQIVSQIPVEEPLEVLTTQSMKELAPRFHYVIQPSSEVLI